MSHQGTMEAIKRARAAQRYCSGALLASLLECPEQLSDALRGISDIRMPVAIDLDMQYILGSVATCIQSLDEGGDLTYEAVCREMAVGTSAELASAGFRFLMTLTSDGKEPIFWASEIKRMSEKCKELGALIWPEALYRWFDSAGILLYIGITNDLPGRQSSHVRKSSWAQFASSATVERFPDRDSVKCIERSAIRAEKPLFNHEHNDTPEARQRLVAYLVEKGRLDLLAPAVSRG